jgi:hypothetical protein
MVVGSGKKLLLDGRDADLDGHAEGIRWRAGPGANGRKDLWFRWVAFG